MKIITKYILFETNYQKIISDYDNNKRKWDNELTKLLKFQSKNYFSSLKFLMYRSIYFYVIIEKPQYESSYILYIKERIDGIEWFKDELNVSEIISEIQFGDSKTIEDFLKEIDNTIELCKEKTKLKEKTEQFNI